MAGTERTVEHSRHCRYATNIWFVLTLTLQGTGWCRLSLPALNYSPPEWTVARSADVCHQCSRSLCMERDECRFGPAAFRRAVVALVSTYDVTPNSEMLFSLGSKGQAAATYARSVASTVCASMCCTAAAPTIALIAHER